MRVSGKILSIIVLWAFALIRPVDAASTNPWAARQPYGQQFGQPNGTNGGPANGTGNLNNNFSSGFGMNGGFGFGFGGGAGQPAQRFVAPAPQYVDPNSQTGSTPKTPQSRAPQTQNTQKWAPQQFGEYPPLTTGNTPSRLEPPKVQNQPAPRPNRQFQQANPYQYRSSQPYYNPYGNNGFGPFGFSPFGFNPFGQSGFNGGFGFGFNGFGSNGFGGQNYGFPGLVAPYPVLPNQMLNYRSNYGQNYGQNYNGYRPNYRQN